MPIEMSSLFLLAVILSIQGIMGAIYDNGQKPVIVPKLPVKRQSCESDAFYSSANYNGKVFLFPWETTHRQGDWMKNYGFCAANCAEMVTISSDAENAFFLDFMRKSIFNVGAIWLGAQVNNLTFTAWINGQANTYDNKAPGEYNEDGLTCLSAGYGVTNDKWYNYYCSYGSYFVACQRPARSTIS